MTIDLTGRVAVVTGAGRGLGRAYAQSLATAGASVVVNDVDAEAAGAVVAEISAAGGDAVAQVAPIGGSDAAEALTDLAVTTFGRLDVMITNAGVLRDTVLWKMSDDDFDTVIDVHLRGTFTCVRAAVRRFREQGDGGRIICIGSPTGQRGTFGQTNYAAAKAGIVGMVRTWALELARARVTANAVIPVAATSMTETVSALAPYVDQLRNGEPLSLFARRALAFGTAEDAAGIVTFLASRESADITGQAIGVGGDRLVLWTHPSPAATAYNDGGWTADDIATAWPTMFGDKQQSVGETLPIDEAPASATTGS